LRSIVIFDYTYFMKKLSTYLFLIFFSFSAPSFGDYKWKKIGKNTAGDVAYVDLSSIKKVGNKVYYFDLLDYVKPTDLGHLSGRTYKEVNCLDLSYRFLKDFYYLEPMGNGKVDLINDKKSEWYNNKKGSLGERLRKFVCNY